MRYRFWLVILLAGTCGAQSRRPDEGRPSSLAREMLAVHNALRARAGVAPLAWSERLAAHSQEWADTLWARRQFFHRPNSAYGENLFEMTGATASSAQVVNAWAAESRNYDYSSNRSRSVAEASREEEDGSSDHISLPSGRCIRDARIQIALGVLASCE